MRKSACRLLAGLFLGCVTHLALAQVGAVQNHCYLGGQQALLSGMQSTNYQNGIVPACTVTVYLTGTQTKATIYADGSGTVLSNPFTANWAGSLNPGGWIFWAATNQALDVVLSGGGSNPSCTTAPNCYTQPITLTDVYPSSQFAVINPLSLQTNGVSNLSQSFLDLDDGSGVVVTNTSSGHVGFAVNPSTLNPPQYQTAAANSTPASTTTTVTLPSVNKGSRLIAFADSNTYNCLPGQPTGSPYYPVVSDSQGNIWTVDGSSFSNYVGGNSGANMIVADTTLSASGSITITATQPAVGGACADAFLLVAEYANVVGVDVAGVQACSLGCAGNLAPSATAVAQNNEVAVVLSETASLSTPTATPGALAFSDIAHNWAWIWQFGAANVGQASTSLLANFNQNFPGAAIILLKSNLTFQTGSTINPGTNYAIARYGPVTSNFLYPSTILSDAAGDLQIPGATAFAIGSIASGPTIQPTKQIFHVTGSLDVDRMVPPGGQALQCDVAGFGCTVTIFADAGFNFVHYLPNLGYSFATSGVASAGQIITFVFDHTTQFWYPLVPPGAAQTTVTGTTAGTAIWSQPQQTTTWKQAVIYLNGYNSTVQTITLPASFATVGYVVTDGGTCTGVTISGATVTLPSAGAQTGLCEIRGY